jgi:hypothetical protein
MERTIRERCIFRSKRLLTDEGSNILVYMTGHGGDGFLKFQVPILTYLFHSCSLVLSGLRWASYDLCNLVKNHLVPVFGILVLK